VLELLRYPKYISAQSGLVAILRGLFAPTVGDYPPLFLMAVATLLVIWSVLVFLRGSTVRRFAVALLATGIVVAVWGLVNGGAFTHAGFSLSMHTGSFTWLWQTFTLVLAGVCIWAWGASHPERAALAVDNLSETWALFRGNRQGMIGLGIIIAFVALSLLAPLLADHARLASDAQYGHLPFEAPRWSYYSIMGTDENGLSVWAEFVWSARISLTVGLMATAISTLLGASIGIAAGYYGGWLGEFWMRITDAFLVIPWLPLAMVLAAVWGHNYGVIILIVGVTSWPGTARIVRSDALRIGSLPFVERARAIGSSGSHIMRKHILTNVFPLIFANTILVVAIAIIAETELSFLGLGDPLNFSWGTMLHNAWAYGGATLPAWWYIIPPGLAIVAVVLAFTFVGTAFDEILDPKLRSREGMGGRRRSRPSALDNLATVVATATIGGAVAGPGQGDIPTERRGVGD
jgi:peptide/nickel transport system permease protein